MITRHQFSSFYLLSFLFLSACGPGQMRTIGSSSIPNLGQGALCQNSSALGKRIRDLNAQNPLPSTATLALGEKLDPEEFTNLKKGTQLILTVDRACAAKWTGPGPLKDIQSQLLPSNLKNKISLDQSVLWTLPLDFKISELRSLVNSIACIKAASPNQNVVVTGKFPTKFSEPIEANDPYYLSLNHLHNVGQNLVYQKLFSKAPPAIPEVLVAVIDSGSELDHPDMQGQFWTNHKELNGLAGIDDDGNGYIDDIHAFDFVGRTGNTRVQYGIPHGDHVAGLIAANLNNKIGVAGIAGSRAKIMHLNIFSNMPPVFEGDGNLIRMEEAIRFAADNGAQVINMSLGHLGRAQTTLQALSYAASKGVVLVAAAGNDSSELISGQIGFSPAIYAEQVPGMLAVGAIDVATEADSAICGFSNYSVKLVDLGAPGCRTGPVVNGILSTVWLRPNDKYNEYGYMEGTSMAAPLVAGAAALIISYIKEKSGEFPTNALVKDILKKGARSQTNLESVFNQGRALDLPSLFNYVDREILQIDPSCQ